jgi:hypothetical protein
MAPINSNTRSNTGSRTLRPEGVAISYDEIRTGGYPLSLTAELVNLALRAEEKA